MLDDCGAVLSATWPRRVERQGRLRSVPRLRVPSLCRPVPVCAIAPRLTTLAHGQDRVFWRCDLHDGRRGRRCQERRHLLLHAKVVRAAESHAE